MHDSLSKSQFADAVGLKQLHRARSTGALVALYDGREQGMDVEGGRWYTICETHNNDAESNAQFDDNLVQHSSLSDARYHAAHPEDWCGGCRRIGARNRGNVKGLR